MTPKLDLKKVFEIDDDIILKKQKIKKRKDKTEKQQKKNNNKLIYSFKNVFIHISSQIIVMAGSLTTRH